MRRPLVADDQPSLRALRDIPKPRSAAGVPSYMRRVLENPLVRQAEGWYERALLGDSSEHAHMKGNSYVPQRRKLHERIVRRLLVKGAEGGGSPSAVFLMGMPGSGKTSALLPDVLAEFGGTRFTTINPDDVKPLLGENYSGIRAPYYHDESSYVAKKLLAREALSRSHNVIFDEVGGGRDSMLERVAALAHAGYDVHVRYAHVPTHVSVGRIVDRFAREGRWVPLDYVSENLEERVEETFLALDESGMLASADKKKTG